MIFFNVLAAWLLADFLTGIVHWFEDRYMDSFSLNLLDSLAKENDLHHKQPTAMTLSTGWTNMKSAAFVGWPVAVLLGLIGMPTVVWLVPFFASFGNLVHRWSHIPKRKLPRWIRAMQEIGLFISQAHHDAHHRSMKRLIPKHLAGFKFCAMTDWVNPVLDAIRFWHWCERGLAAAGLPTTQSKRGDDDQR
jgi:ubiquitin-conjugating enzyme E2 variant